VTPIAPPLRATTPGRVLGQRVAGVFSGKLKMPLPGSLTVTASHLMGRNDRHLSRREIIGYCLFAVVSFPAFFYYDHLATHKPLLHFVITILIRVFAVAFFGVCAVLFWFYLYHDIFHRPVILFPATARQAFGVLLRRVGCFCGAVFCTVMAIRCVVSLVRLIIEAI